MAVLKSDPRGCSGTLELTSGQSCHTRADAAEHLSWALGSALAAIKEGQSSCDQWVSVTCPRSLSSSGMGLECQPWVHSQSSVPALLADFDAALSPCSGSCSSTLAPNGYSCCPQEKRT